MLLLALEFAQLQHLSRRDIQVNTGYAKRRAKKYRELPSAKLRLHCFPLFRATYQFEY
jgi:hypothetical protein